jgi:hypothetical protein
VAAGVVDLSDAGRQVLGRWLTFDSLPTADQLVERAELIAQAATGDSLSVDVLPGCMFAMLGGAPFFMSALENALIDRGITPLYAFSVRSSTEEALPDGTVRKVNTFKHLGFVQI